MAPVGGISYIACWPACLFYMIILMQLRLLVSDSFPYLCK